MISRVVKVVLRAAMRTIRSANDQPYHRLAVEYGLRFFVCLWLLRRLFLCPLCSVLGLSLCSSIAALLSSVQFVCVVSPFLSLVLRV